MSNLLLRRKYLRPDYPNVGWIRQALRTRFYLPSNGTGEASPAFGGEWEDTTITTRLRSVRTRINSAMTTVNFTDVSVADRDILFRQYISDPLAAQTFDPQTIRLQVRGSETLATNNMFVTWNVKAVSEDGATARGTLVSIQRDGTEVDTTLTNRGDSATASSFTIQEGDRLVFEIGMGGAPVAVHDSSLSLGDDNATDLPEDDSTTNANNPWVELGVEVRFSISRALLAGIWWQQRESFRVRKAPGMERLIPLTDLPQTGWMRKGSLDLFEVPYYAATQDQTHSFLSERRSRAMYGRLDTPRDAWWTAPLGLWETPYHVPPRLQAGDSSFRVPFAPLRTDRGQWWKPDYPQQGWIDKIPGALWETEYHVGTRDQSRLEFRRVPRHLLLVDDPNLAWLFTVLAPVFDPAVLPALWQLLTSFRSERQSTALYRKLDTPTDAWQTGTLGLWEVPYGVGPRDQSHLDLPWAGRSYRHTDDPSLGWLFNSLAIFDPAILPALWQLLHSFRSEKSSTAMYHRLDTFPDAWWTGALNLWEIGYHASTRAQSDLSIRLRERIPIPQEVYGLLDQPNDNPWRAETLRLITVWWPAIEQLLWRERMPSGVRRPSLDEQGLGWLFTALTPVFDPAIFPAIWQLSNSLRSTRQSIAQYRLFDTRFDAWWTAILGLWETTYHVGVRAQSDLSIRLRERVPVPQELYSLLDQPRDDAWRQATLDLIVTWWPAIEQLLWRERTLSRNRQPILDQPSPDWLPLLYVPITRPAIEQLTWRERMPFGPRWPRLDQPSPDWLPSTYIPITRPALDFGLGATRTFRLPSRLLVDDQALGWLFVNLPSVFDTSFWPAIASGLDFFRTRDRAMQRWWLSQPEQAWIFNAVPGFFDPAFYPGIGELLASFLSNRRSQATYRFLDTMPDAWWTAVLNFIETRIRKRPIAPIVHSRRRRQ